MYKIYSEGVLYFRGFDYEKIKLREAYCRGNQLDYEITYPDGSRLECKFKNKIV